MVKQKKLPFYVVRARPLDQGGGGGNAYYADDGSPTTNRQRAAKFLTFGDAEEFAKKKSITLDSIRYIDREEFADSEVE